MNILSIGSDRLVFDLESRVRARLSAYGEVVDAYHVVIMCGRGVRYSAAACTPSTRVTLHPTYSWNRFLYPFDACIAALRVVRSAVPRRGEWVVTAQDPFESGVAALVIATLFRLPLQIQLHTDPFSASFRSRSTLNVVRLYLARLVIPRATRVRVVSQTLQQMVHVRYGVPIEHIDILPVLVERQNQELSGGHEPVLHRLLPEGSRSVVMVGRLAPEKDWDTAFAAFRKVLEYYPDTYLVIVGDGPLRPQLEKKASNQMYANKVLFLGWQHDVVPYLRDADLFLFTSQYEGYGMVLIEAALAGVPIVSTDVGIANEYFGNHGAARICPVGDSECLALRLQQLLGDATARQALGQHAHDRALSLYTSTLSEYASRQAEIWKVLLLTNT